MKQFMYPNIEAERARRGMTVGEMTEELGVTRKTYYNWISQGKIPMDKLDLLSALFGVSVDYLLGYAE